MNILSIDTSAGVATAAFSVGDKLKSEIIINNKLTHSETLMPIIDEVLKNSEADISDVDLIAVANGPGSFTGLRIGVSCAKGIAGALNIKMAGISTLTAMAYNLSYCQHLICPIMDARRSQVYNAIYRWEDNELIEVKAPRALSIEELIEELNASGRTVVFLGDGVPVHKEIIKKSLPDTAIFAPVGSDLQRASSLIPYAKKLYDEGGVVDAQALQLVYLRKPQAERELEERNK